MSLFISVVLGTHNAGKNAMYTILKSTNHMVTDNVSKVKGSQLSTVTLFFQSVIIFQLWEERVALLLWDF